MRFFYLRSIFAKCELFHIFKTMPLARFNTLRLSLGTGALRSPIKSYALGFNVSYIALLVVSVAVFLWLAQLVLPKFFFRLRYFINSSVDRGIASYKERSGKTIVYRPHYSYRQFIDQYIISKRRGRTVFIYKTGEKQPAHIDYDIVVLNKSYKVSAVINVKEDICGKLYSKERELPKDTRCISLIVNEADGVSLPKPKKEKPIIDIGMAGCALAVFILSILEVFFINYCIANTFGDVYASDFITSTRGIIMVLIGGAVVSFFNMLPLLFHFRRRKNKPSLTT